MMAILLIGKREEDRKLNFQVCANPFVPPIERDPQARDGLRPRPLGDGRIGDASSRTYSTHGVPDVERVAG